ncbi:hypothetical protein [Taibaiella sp. KBW10]|uniref:hypothetical protein n=1 Tax=Taibaiella sp. KBW10 TaxID=2153357 RepID=UPI000F5AF7CF|nr:hypothetical protein [Taibaiella sp. KBW10]
MRSKTTPVLPTLLFIGLLFAGFFLYKQHEEIKMLNATIKELQAGGNTNCCSDSTVPTYSSIGYDEFEENVAYFKESIGNSTINAEDETKSLWMSVGEMENYLCVIRNRTKAMNIPPENLGLRIYFIRYKPTHSQFDNKLSIAFIPTYKSERGQNQDYETTRLSSELIGGGKTFIMNRIMPCPVNCDGVLLR